MSFDMEPDHDEHGLCKHEIDSLTAKIERLEAEIERSRHVVELAELLLSPALGRPGLVDQI